MNITKKIIALACFGIISLRAMEEKIEPCSQEDHRKFLQEFEKQGCDYKCRTEQLEKLASIFVLYYAQIKIPRVIDMRLEMKLNINKLTTGTKIITGQSHQQVSSPYSLLIQKYHFLIRLWRTRILVS